MASPLGGSNDDDVAACMEKAVMTAMRIRKQRSDSRRRDRRPCVVIGVDKLIPVSEGEDGIFREKQPERIYRGRYCHAR